MRLDEITDPPSGTDPSFSEFCFSVDETTVHLVFPSDEIPMTLMEAKHRGDPLIGKYSAKLHKAHIPQGQDHLHVYAKNNELFALNIDGSAHDRSHGNNIPNRVADAIVKKYSEFTLSPGNIIESAPADIQSAYRALFE